MKIVVALYLKRYHDATVGKSGVWRILKRLDLGRPRSGHAGTRPQPGLIPKAVPARTVTDARS